MSSVVPKGGLDPLAVDSAAYNELKRRIIETQPSTSISTEELEALLTEAANALSKPRMVAKSQQVAYNLKQDGVDTYRDFAAVDLEMLRGSGLNLIESRWVLDLLSPSAAGAPSLSALQDRQHPRRVRASAPSSRAWATFCRVTSPSPSPKRTEA